MTSAPVAVIDIGSNSIKVLVAHREPGGTMITLAVRTIDARISAGINRTEPRLSEEGMARGLEAVRVLLGDAAAFAPARTILVATSAVRDAHNGRDFCGRIRTATGHDVRILTGEEEANLIGRGLTVDPALAGLRDFYLFDLGGGSLECLAYRQQRREQAVSLQLGSVRLTEKFVPDPARPLDNFAQRAIAEHVRAEMARARFQFSLPAASTAVGTGGTVSTARAILGAREGKTFEATPSRVTVDQLVQLLSWLGALPLADRKLVAGLPPGRADVFPTALVTLLALAELGGFTAFQHSLYNLRYGLADEALPQSTGAAPR